jgi:plastocyanin
MTPKKAILVAAALSVVLAGSAVLGCSNSNSPTYGGSPGGSGGGNTPFDSGSLTAPANYVRTFPTAGSVAYHCTFHVSMGMTGTVTIVAGAADSGVVTASGTSFAPPAVSIRPGGYVHWKVTGGTHTVTSD